MVCSERATTGHDPALRARAVERHVRRRRGPAARGQAVQRLLGRRAGPGRVHDEDLADVGQQLESVVVEREVADEGVMERLAAAAVLQDVLGGPANTELLAPGGKLADEVGEVAVVGIPAGFGPEAADGGVGDAVPVPVERRATGRRGTRTGPGWRAGRGWRRPPSRGRSRAGWRRGCRGDRCGRRRPTRRSCRAPAGRSGAPVAASVAGGWAAA